MVWALVLVSDAAVTMQLIGLQLSVRRDVTIDSRVLRHPISKDKRSIGRKRSAACWRWEAGGDVTCSVERSSYPRVIGGRSDSRSVERFCGS
jgi:hypothetical protein